MPISCRRLQHNLAPLPITKKYEITSKAKRRNCSSSATSNVAIASAVKLPLDKAPCITEQRFNAYALKSSPATLLTRPACLLLPNHSTAVICPIGLTTQSYQGLYSIFPCIRGNTLVWRCSLEARTIQPTLLPQRTINGSSRGWRLSAATITQMRAKQLTNANQTAIRLYLLAE